MKQMHTWTNLRGAISRKCWSIMHSPSSPGSTARSKKQGYEISINRPRGVLTANEKPPPPHEGRCFASLLDRIPIYPLSFLDLIAKAL